MKYIINHRNLGICKTVLFSGIERSFDDKSIILNENCNK